LLYGNPVGIQTLKMLSKLNDSITWWDVCCNYFKHRYHTGEALDLPSKEQVEVIQKEYLELVGVLNGEAWKANNSSMSQNLEEYRKEMLLAAEGICLMAELSGKLAGYKINKVADTGEWMNRYSRAWLKKNKPSELRKIEELFTYYESL